MTTHNTGIVTFIWNFCTSKPEHKTSGFKYGTWSGLLYFTINRNKNYSILQAPIQFNPRFPLETRVPKFSLKNLKQFKPGHSFNPQHLKETTEYDTRWLVVCYLDRSKINWALNMMLLNDAGRRDGNKNFCNCIWFLYWPCVQLQ